MGKLVCLDPGHNLQNGNRSPDGTYYEWEFNQDVCNRAEAIIKRIPGLDCIKIKEADTYPTTLDMRVKVAHDAGADLFLSQHTNAYGSGWTSPNGFGVYPYPGKDEDLAKICLTWCEMLLPMKSRGIRESNFFVTRETKMPAVLIETGFHTNKEDVAKLKTSAFRDLAAMVLVRTACTYLQVPYLEIGIQEVDTLDRLIVAHSEGDRFAKEELEKALKCGSVLRSNAGIYMGVRISELYIVGGPPELDITADKIVHLSGVTRWDTFQEVGKFLGHL